MHDIDKISMESNGFDYEEEFDQENPYGFQGEFDQELDDEYQDEIDDESAGNPFNEEEEAELAFELLSVDSEEELDEFFKSLMSKAVRGLRKIGSSHLFQTIGKGLKSVAKKALPLAGGALGTFFGGPVGAAIGSKLGGAASNLFEIELEGLSPEDQEFELAKRLVRYSGAAARNAYKLGNRMTPVQAVNVGFKNAARQHAPGMLKSNGYKRPTPPAAAARDSYGSRQTGRWMRKGNKIILFGLG